jgi:hypothetical protein
MGKIPPKFKLGAKVVISHDCNDEEYRGISGTLLDVDPVPFSHKRRNRVCLDRPVNNACVFWFTDDELQDANTLVVVEEKQLENQN